MTILEAILIFSISAALMIISSFVLSGSLEKLKLHYNISGGLLGMLVALCAATPEISSAVTALMLKQHDVGVGIIIGSNIFNLEALLGVSALIAGRLQIKRQALVFNRFSSSPMMRNWRISLKTIYSEMCK